MKNILYKVKRLKLMLLMLCLALALVLLLSTAFRDIVLTAKMAHTKIQPEIPEGQNLALGKSYVLFPQPNHQYCTDPEDSVQLTDGQKTTSHFWTQKGTVGWQGIDYATITIDLGQVVPIAGISVTTAAGITDVTWPMAIQILVSDDGETFYDAGDLVTLDLQKQGPWPDGYAIRELATDALQTYGRFVQFVLIPLPSGIYMFTDEIEIIRGADALLKNRLSRGEPTTAKKVYEEGRLLRALQYRWVQDTVKLSKLINESTLDELSKNSVVDRLKDVQTLEPDTLAATSNMRITLPVGPRHEELFKTQAYLWKELGHPALSVWTPNIWDPLELITIPPVPTANNIQVDTMHGEYRAAALNLANSTEKTLQVSISFQGLPNSPAPDYVTLQEVQWTDTSLCIPVAAALPEASRDTNAWNITVLPGVVRQVWMTFHVTGLPPGEYKGELVIKSPGMPTREVPVYLKVWPLEFPQSTTLWLGGCDYTDGYNLGITPQNRTTFIEHLQSHFVNAPWAHGYTIMNDFRFDKADFNKIELNTQRFDDWVSKWPQAQVYFVFLNVKGTSSFGGAEIGKTEFNQRVGTWISAWVRHMKSKGIAPERMAFLLHDEPRETDDIKPMLAWAKAIRAAAPMFMIWEDPIYRNPAEAPAELFEASDTLCINRQMWLSLGESFAGFYHEQQTLGRTLNLNSTSGLTKLLDPYSYYRLQAWHAWQIGANGSFFWAFGDNSGTSSWSESLYQGKNRRGLYSPLFIDESTITASKQMEAIRESVEDYEYFVMLSKAVEESKTNGHSNTIVTEAEILLKTAATHVLTAENANRMFWNYPKDRTVADHMRIKILQALVSLRT